MFDDIPLSGLKVPLQRPEYASTPEILLSSIAWADQRPTFQKDNCNLPVGIIYQDIGSSNPTGFFQLKLKPRTESERRTVTQLAKKAGILPNDQGREPHEQEVAGALLNSILGNRAGKATAVPIAPITPELARLQNSTGLVRKKGPAAYGAILSAIYDLGAPTISPDAGIQSVWLKGAELQMKRSELLRHVDDFALRIRDNKFSDLNIETPQTTFKSKRIEPMTILENKHTPFNWFHNVWNRLNSSEWIEVLSPRIWTDWLLTALRMAFAFSYLWECKYYDSLARKITGSEPHAFEQFIAGDTPLLPWVASSSTPSQRNVQPAIKDTVRRGVSARASIEETIKERGLNPGDSSLRDLRSDAFRELLQTKYLQSDSMPTSYKNMRESIFYSLRDRESTDGPRDYYAVIRRITNQTAVISPGTEWVTMMASLACEEPGGETTLRELNNDLRKLGLIAPARDLIQLLEMAGLATGSADADQGVRIKSAY